MSYIDKIEGQLSYDGYLLKSDPPRPMTRQEIVELLTSQKEKVLELVRGMKAEEYTDPASNLGGAAHNEGFNLALSSLETQIENL